MTHANEMRALTNSYETRRAKTVYETSAFIKAMDNLEEKIYNIANEGGDTCYENFEEFEDDLKVINHIKIERHESIELFKNILEKNGYDVVVLEESRLRIRW
jgi:hypothetical protein